MRIQHNILAMNAYRNYNNNTSALSKNLEKLSSGYKINRAGDDAAGLAISEKMRAQITGLSAAQKNVKDGISLVKTAEGAMQEIHDMLNRMDYLATQSANGTYDNEVDRLNLQKEITSLKDEINRIADSANFNGIKLLDGKLGSQSISALGALDTKSMIDGTDPSQAGKAVVKVTLGSLTPAGEAKDEGTETKVATVKGSTNGGIVKTGEAGVITLSVGGLKDATEYSITGATVGGNAVDADGLATVLDDLSGWTGTDSITFDVAGHEVSFTHGNNGAAGFVTDFNAAMNQFGLKAEVDADNTDKVNISILDGQIASTTGATAADEGYLDDGTGTEMTIDKNTSVDQIKGMKITAADGNQYKIEDYFDVAKNGGTFTLTALTTGNLANGDGAAANAIAKALTGLTAQFDDGAGNAVTPNDASTVVGKVELTKTGKDDALDDGVTPATATKYELEFDWSKLTAGTELTFGTGADAKTFVFTKDGTVTGTEVNGKIAVNIDTATTAADKAAALKTALEHDNGLGTTNFDVAVNGDKVTVTGKADDVADTNLGQVRTNNKAWLPDDQNVYTPGTPEITPDSAPAAYHATATFELEGIKEGSTITIGDNSFEVVAEVKDSSTQVSFDDLATDLVKAYELASGDDDNKLGTLSGVTFTDGKLTFTMTSTALGEKGEDYAKTLVDEENDVEKITVTNKTPAVPVPEADIKAATATSEGGLKIQVGKTTLDELKGMKIDTDDAGNDLTVGQLFNVEIATGGVDKDGVIQSGAKITFTATQKGELSGDVMSAVTFNGKDANATSEVTPGWDEGKTAADQNTHYGLTIDTGKLAGGQAFSFGNVNGESFTFDITYDADLTGNGTVNKTGTDGKKEEVGTRTEINLSSSMTAEQQAAAIKTAVEGVMGTDFNVKVEVTDAVEGGTDDEGNEIPAQAASIKLTVDAKDGDAKYNLGGVRYSSEAGAFSGAEYIPYNALKGGTEGTYAQVSYEFDAKKLGAGDTVKIGDVSITVGDKTEVKDGKITLSEKDAREADKLVSAFESAGYQSGQLKIADGKLTITGTKTGQTAEDLSKNSGRVLVTSTRNLSEGGLTLQIGDTSDDFNQLTVAVGDMHTKAMGIDAIDIGTQEGAKAAIDIIKNAINYVSGVRGDLGAIQNRLDHTANNLSVMAENIQDAESTIRDTDVAEEMMAYTKNNILIQSAQAMLAQANQIPQGVLQLLG